MNSLYNNALKQSHALQKDLDSKVFIYIDYKATLCILLTTPSALQNFNQGKMLRLVYKVKILFIFILVSILTCNF